MTDETTAPETRQGASDGLAGTGVGDSLAGEVEALARVILSATTEAVHATGDDAAYDDLASDVARAVLATGYRRENREALVKAWEEGYVKCSNDFEFALLCREELIGDSFADNPYRSEVQR